MALGKGGTDEDQIDPSKFLKVGDKVLYGRYSGDEIKLKDKDGKEIEVRILRLEAVLGIVS